MSTSLDDFRTAAEATGVNLIPFYDLRKDATPIADDVQSRKEEAKLDPSTLEKQKDNLLEEIKKKNEEIENVKKEIEDFKNRHPEGSVTTFEDEIKEHEEEIEEYNGKIGDLNNKIANAIDAFERLYHARAGLREYFDKAKDQLKDVRSDPAKYLEAAHQMMTSTLCKGISGLLKAGLTTRKQTTRYKRMAPETQWKISKN